MSVFNNRVPRRPHLVRHGKGGVGGDVGDLRKDTADAFELLQSFAAAERGIHVMKSGDDVTATGSITSPFKTIQAAIDYAISLSPAAFDGYTVFIHPGDYEESLILDADGVYLYGVGWTTPYIHGPAGSPAITVTNATRASLATYRSSGTYSDLVNKGDAGPVSPYLVNLFFQGIGATAVEFLGVKGDASANTTNFCQYGAAIAYTSIVGAMYAKNVCSLLHEGMRLTGNSNLYEVSNLGMKYCEILDNFTHRFDGANADGWAHTASVPASLRFSSFFDILTADEGSTLSLANCYVEDELQANVDGNIVGKSVHVGALLDVNGTGDVTIHGLHLEGNLTAEAAATMTLNAPHISGDVTLANGAGAVVFNGGEYMGSLTDAGGRLTFNLGTIGT